VEYTHKDLLGLKDLTADEINTIIQTAIPCKEIFKRSIKKLPTLRGKVVVNAFYEPSTRTRTSFEMAGKWMSADVVNISVSTSSVVKGESFTDTIKTLEALGADIVVIRHSSSGAAALTAKSIKARVINAGDGIHEHPTQALLDIFTIKEKLGSLQGLKVCIVGDILHSRVARSNIWGLTKLGAQVRVVGPPTLMPSGLGGLGVQVYYDLEEAIKDVDVINVLRIQLERQNRGLFPSLEEYNRLFGLTKPRLKQLKKDTLILHPGPANLGVEITPEVVEDPRSAIREQVSNGVAVRMALLYLLSGGKGDALVS
jgi:aspartate carbamoyltransferase catalytic subunit